MPSIHVEWDEPLENLIDPQAVKEALKAATQEHVMTDPVFRAAVVTAVREAGGKMVSQAIAESVKAEIFNHLQKKQDMSRKELATCLADYKAMGAMHASDYANRRYAELLKSLSEIDAM